MITMRTQTTAPLCAALLAAVLLLVAAQSQADGSLDQCQRLKGKITYYTDKRRAGGSSRQMQAWKEQRKAMQRAFKQYRCARYGSRLG